MNNIIEARDLSFAYIRNTVLRDLDLAVGAGEVVGLLGRNGAGKTTFFQLALGMLAPGEGSIAVFGQDPVREPVAVRRRIGFVAETQTFPGHLKVSHVLDVHRRLYPTWDDEFEERLLHRFDLDPTRRIASLSKGQARQVALVAAVAHRPELLLLDEPAGGLDPVVRRRFLETTVELLASEGTTIVFSTHQTLDLERMAGRVVMLDGGRVRLDAATDNLREDVCLVVYPESLGRRALGDGIPGDHGDVLGWRRKGDMIHAVVARPMADVEARFQALDAGPVSGAGVVCRPVPLEELFIELLDDQVSPSFAVGVLARPGDDSTTGS